MAASKQANIHTHVHNAVPLVWDSLRLVPITVLFKNWNGWLSTTLNTFSSYQTLFLIRRCSGIWGMRLVSCIGITHYSLIIFHNELISLPFSNWPDLATQQDKHTNAKQWNLITPNVLSGSPHLRLVVVISSTSSLALKRLSWLAMCVALSSAWIPVKTLVCLCIVYTDDPW